MNHKHLKLTVNFSFLKQFKINSVLYAFYCQCTALSSMCYLYIIVSYVWMCTISSFNGPLFTVHVSSSIFSFGNLLNLDFVTFLWHRQRFTFSFRHHFIFAVCMCMILRVYIIKAATTHSDSHILAASEWRNCSKAFSSKKNLRNRKIE